MKHWFSDLAAFRRDPLDFFTRHGRAAASPLVELGLGPRPVYLVTDPALVRPIFKAPEKEIDKGRLIYKLREIMGRSSISLSGPEHRERRAAMHEQLARGLATSYVPEICAVIRRQALALAADGTFVSHEVTAPLALRIISLLLFGRGALTQADENTLVEAVHLVEEDLAASLFKIVPDLPWVHARKKRKLRQGREMMNFVVDRARRNATSGSLLTALQAINLSDQDLRDEILLLFLAGHHTSGSAAAWLLYHLGTDPELCAAIAQEAAAISDATGEIRPDRLSSATRSLALSHEVLRLYPPAWWMSREVQAPIELAGTNLKRGTSLVVAPWHMQRDPRFWDEPDTFRLDRQPLRNPAYMPFGVGPRVCVGMGVALLELQLIALEFASAFEMTVTSEVPAPRPSPRVTIVPPRIDIAVRMRAVPARQPGRAVA